MAKELEDKIYNKNTRKFHFSGHLTIKWIKIRLVCLQMWKYLHWLSEIWSPNQFHKVEVKSQQGWTLSRDLGENALLPLPTPAGCQHSLLCGCITPLSCLLSHRNLSSAWGQISSFFPLQECLWWLLRPTWIMQDNIPTSKLWI